MESLIEWASGNSWWIYVTTAVTVATAITAVLPSSIKDNPAYNVFMKVVNLMAGAIGKGKPADDKTKIVIK